MAINIRKISAFVPPKNSFELLQENFIDTLSKTLKKPELIKSKLEFGKKVITELETLNENKNGLIVGHVQSGKTISFLSCINYALQNEYDIVIVLTSIENNLNKQTQKRIQDSFTKSEDGSESLVEFLNGRDFKIDKHLYTTVNKIESILEANKKLIVTSLKNSQIENIRLVLKELENIKKLKLLIVDDEGDLASLSQTNKKENVIDSKANSYIKSLLNTFNNKIFISVTATPYVHLFVENNEELFINRIFTIDPGKNYFGLNEFFSTENKDKYFSLIDNIQDLKSNSLSEVFKKSIVYFWIAHSIRVIQHDQEYETNNGINKVSSNMLIHTEVKTLAHNKLANSLYELKRSFLDSLCISGDEKMLKVGSLEFEMTKQYILEIVEEYYKKYYPETYDIIRTSFNEFLTYLINVIKKIDVKVVNNTTNNDNDLKLNFNSNILIGSKMLERGLTIPNLICTVFSNQSESSFALDTSLQRARWFGYREKIIDFLRIFTTKRIYDDFVDMKYLQNKTWESLKDLEANKLSLDNIDWVSINWSNLHLTMTNKRSNNNIKLSSVYVNNSISEQTESVSHFLQYLFNAVNEEYSKTHQTLNIGSKQFGYIKFENCFDFKEYIKYHDDSVKLKLIKALFRDQQSNKSKIIQAIFNLVQNTNSNVYLVNMNNDSIKNTLRHRSTLTTNNDLINLFSGRHNDYVGDLNWVKQVDKLANSVIFQIHQVEINNKTMYFLSCLTPYEDMKVMNKK